PSDNLGAVLAAAELADRTGAELLVALAVAYQVQCRLSDEAPVRDRGFDHTTQGAFAATAGVARALGLDAARTAHALAIAGTTAAALRVTRTGALSHWKGLAAPHAGFCAVHAALLARAGVTGPAAVLEGAKGFMEVVSGPFHIDWEREDLARVTRTDLKRYNAEIHAQSALEAVLELRAAARLTADAVARVELETFQVAYDIIGGGAEGPKTAIATKEEADHSLPYLLAVALLDGEVGPAQYAPARIVRPDVQALLQRVFVRPAADLTRRFPAETPGRVRVVLRDGRELRAERRDWAGCHGRPLPWDAVRGKLDGLAARVTTAAQRDGLAAAVARLEELRVRDLTALLRAVRGPAEE
ncbi:MAG TPA: MmgE/PrpD family protein, partial [Polyangia bacterium]